MKATPTALLVDIGNTSTTIGVARHGTILRVSRLATHHPDPERAIRMVICRSCGRVPPGEVVLCSVVPALTPIWVRLCRKVCTVRPWIVNHRLRLGVTIAYPHPATIGADRLANASAAAAFYGVPVIVADFGTALTFDIVSRRGAYIGGVIAPGLPLMTDYLAERTALLPHIALEGRLQRIGRSTVAAMRIGALVGYRGMVREIVAHIQRGMSERQVTLVATGGYAARALRGIGFPITIDPDLTLKGLIHIRSLNKSAK